MTWGAHHEYPRAIIHIDGDSFFASCEVAKNPKLRGKPVITGKERGIVSAATYEAKARGVTRGMKLSDVRRVCPDAVILPSDYETYSLFSRRMYDIVRRYTPSVEEYSIDECFAELTGLRSRLHAPYPVIAERIKNALESELGITFSIGLSGTKVLAKIGSKWKKPSGLTLIPLTAARQFLAETPVGHVWGIGPNTAALLNRYGVRTAQEFTERDEAWVKEKLAKPYLELWKELRGESVLPLDTVGRQGYDSISKTKTFTPPSKDSAFVFSQLSKNIENACIKARRWGLVAPEISFFLKTQDFKYSGCELKLASATNMPQDILTVVQASFSNVFRPGEQYRATGITLMKLTDQGAAQLDLFGCAAASAKLGKVFAQVDELSERYGKHAVFLGSSFSAMHRPDSAKAMLGKGAARNEMSARVYDLFKGETSRRRLGIPMLGEVS